MPQNNFTKYRMLCIIYRMCLKILKQLQSNSLLLAIIKNNLVKIQCGAWAISHERWLIIKELINTDQ